VEGIIGFKTALELPTMRKSLSRIGPLSDLLIQSLLVVDLVRVLHLEMGILQILVQVRLLLKIPELRSPQKKCHEEGG
jgi:hypothetical protein